jgi:hypothetical protein
MSRDRVLTESRLHEALNRLLDGKPRLVKAHGKLTLNKVNNEANLGNSYVHKFPDFVEHAKPIIAEYNEKHDKAMASGLDIEIGVSLSDSEIQRAKFNKVEALKEKYKAERDNAIAARKIVEGKYSELMFRCYELQVELLRSNKTVTPFRGRD